MLMVYAINENAKAEDILQREQDVAYEVYEKTIIENRDTLNHSLKAYYPDWMGNVDGKRLISTLSIPGTHESCARYGGSFAECQDMSLQEQLMFGVRFFDIRCRHINDCFMIHHDLIYQELSFGSGVRDVFVQFLKEHPAETILMIVKEEYDATGNTRTFCETMQSYLVGFDNYFYLTEDMPTLEQVRGKIVLFRRFTSTIYPMGNNIRFSDNSIFTSSTTIKARVQDCYSVSIFDREKKWNNVAQILNEAVNNNDDTLLFLNYASGASVLCFPSATASYITPKVGDYVRNSYLKKNVGVILLDFIEKKYDDLILFIIQRNYE